MAASSAAIDDLEVVDDRGALRWYEPASGVYYGFCQVCGSTLFWRTNNNPAYWSIAAGTLDQPTGLVTVDAWFVADASDYHRLDSELIQHAYDGG